MNTKIVVLLNISVHVAGLWVFADFSNAKHFQRCVISLAGTCYDLHLFRELFNMSPQTIPDICF